ncbi:MAG: hypothetical protein AAFY60_07800, partial [Myxococcota bacterium]
SLRLKSRVVRPRAESVFSVSRLTVNVSMSGCVATSWPTRWTSWTEGAVSLLTENTLSARGRTTRLFKRRLKRVKALLVRAGVAPARVRTELESSADTDAMRFTVGYR